MDPSKARWGLTQAVAIWLLVFAGGWFVMLTELVAARVLAPYFGNTIYVWGSVIAVFMLALAVGYALGGRMTSRSDSVFVPAILAAAAGVYVAVTPFYQDHLSAWLYNTGIHVKWGALFASLVLYGPPMALLGALSPYCIHIVTRTHTEAGSRAGVLYAISTMGSFLGCLVTAFVLIPGLPLTQVTFCAGIGTVIVSGIVSLVLANKKVPAVAIAVLIVIAAPVISHRYNHTWQGEMKAYQYPLKNERLSDLTPEQLVPVLKKAQADAAKEATLYFPDKEKTLLEMETPYHHLTVRQVGPVRELTFGKSGFHTPQTIVDLRNLSWHIAEYTQLSFAGLFYGPAPKRVLVIGVGGATIPRALERCFPGVQVDAVDIDPTIIKVAEKYFYWRPSKNVMVYGQDGRSFLNWAIVNKKPLYDWVIIDAYNDDFVPFHLTTGEFVGLVQRVLKPSGILATNMIIEDDLYGCEARTYKAVFGNVTGWAGHRSANVILVSQNGRTKPLTVEEASAAAKDIKLPKDCGVDPRFMLSCLMTDQNWSDNGPMLTDMWAPVENLLK